MDLSISTTLLTKRFCYFLIGPNIATQLFSLEDGANNHMKGAKENLEHHKAYSAFRKEKRFHYHALLKLSTVV